MNFVIRNFFYAVGLVALFALYSLDPAAAQFGDLVRLTHSPVAQKAVGLVTLILCALDFLSGSASSGSSAPGAVNWAGGAHSVGGTFVAKATAPVGRGSADGEKLV